MKEAVVRFWDVGSGKTFHEIALKGSYQDAAFSPPPTSSRSSGGTIRTGRNRPSEDVLWLIDTAARKLVRTVPLPARIGWE